MIPPTASWLNTPVLAMREGFKSLEASRLTMQQAIATSVHDFVPSTASPSAAPTNMPEAAGTEEAPTKERTKFNKTNEIRTYLLSHLYERICIRACTCLHAHIYTDSCAIHLNAHLHACLPHARTHV